MGPGGLGLRFLGPGLTLGYPALGLAGHLLHAHTGLSAQLGIRPV